MMQTLLFTGSGAIAMAAAATAAAAAAAGTRTLLLSVGPSHSISTLAGVAPSGEFQTLGPNLDLWTMDILGEFGSLWNGLRGRSALPGPAIGGDELPLLPGSDLFMAVARLRGLASSYELVCVDAGPHDGLLRALSVPDTFRWMLRLLLGLDREPGRSGSSMGRAIVPSALIPFEWVGQVQEARVQFERLRDETVDARQTRVRYLLRPERGGLDEALLAVPALQLFGLAVEHLIAGPMLPAGTGGQALAGLLAEQAQVAAEAAQVWAAHPLVRLAATATPGSVDGLDRIGAELYGAGGPLPMLPLEGPLSFGGPPDPYVAIHLPGLRREALGLTLSGDELIVRVGPYRRHLLLPPGLRGSTNIRAARQGDTLFVRPRT